MPRVTALRETRRGVVVDLDETEWRTLPVDVVVRAELSVGTELDRLRAREVRRALRRHQALARAARALRTRDLTVRALDERLARAGYGGDERRDAVGTLERAGVVDDGRYAAARAASLADRGWGDAAIAWRLEQAGVPAALVAEAIATLAPEGERACSLAATRGGARGAAAFLARRGFSEAAIESTIGAEPGGEID